MKLLPYVVEWPHHSDVPLHTCQAQEQRLYDEHQRVCENHHLHGDVILPEKEVESSHGQEQVEQDLCDGQVEGEEICGEDPSSFGP